MANNYMHLRLSFLLLFITWPLSLALQVGFYSESCPNAESIIRQIVERRYNATKAVTPALLRMFFHDCFVRGCDASLLIDSTSNNQTEKSAGANLTIRELVLIDSIKSKLERTCPQIVSCADIIALATRDAVVLSGGPKYDIPTGRRDGLVSLATEVDLPSPTFTISQAKQAFATKGFTLEEMVVLLGGHTVGLVHCSFFQDRLTNFSGSGAPDPTMRKGLVTKLRGICESNPNLDPTVFLDQNTSLVFDNEYYNQIRNNRGVLKFDQDLALDPLTSVIVSNLAANSSLFQESFANAMIKLGNVEVLEGTSGEIRRNCRVFNS